jgi:hypothetical protein
MKLRFINLNLHMSRVTLMRSFTVVAFLVGIASYIGRPEWSRQQLISEIAVNGGSVTYDESLRTLFRTQRVVHVNLPDRTEITFDELRIFPNLDTIALPGFVYSQQGVPGKVVMRIEDVEHLYEIMPKNT